MSNNEKSDVARLLVSHASSLQIHTGNIINWYSLKKGVGQKTSEELLDSVENAVNSWTNSIELDLINVEEPLNTVDIANRALDKRFEKDEREKLKISVKIFLTQWKPQTIRHAVEKVCQSLDLSSVDSVIVSFPVIPLQDITNNNNSAIPDFNEVKLVWKEMECLVDIGMISHIGVTDFDKPAMEELYNWARIKPTMDQINMTSCCTVPADLIEFSKKYDIELLSHNDAAEMMPSRVFQTMVQNTVQDMSSGDWVPSYIARYSVIVRCRGIVEAKGYFVGAERKFPNRPEDYGFF